MWIGILSQYAGCQGRSEEKAASGVSPYASASTYASADFIVLSSKKKGARRIPASWEGYDGPRFEMSLAQRAKPALLPVKERKAGANRSGGRAEL